MKAIVLLMTCCMMTAPVFSDGWGEDPPDKAFVLSAADGGMLEVALGQLAVKNASNAKSRDFGKMMIRDHTAVNSELKALAGKKKLVIPTKLSAAKQQMYDSLAAMKGEKFDMLYMNMMIASHEETIGLFQTESKNGRDPDLKKWADSKIISLKHHLEMAKALFAGSSNSTAK